MNAPLSLKRKSISSKTARAPTSATIMKMSQHEHNDCMFLKQIDHRVVFVSSQLCKNVRVKILHIFCKENFELLRSSSTRKSVRNPLHTQFRGSKTSYSLLL